MSKETKKEEVEVVMTKSEMDEYLKFKADKDTAAKELAESKELVQVHLRFDHRVNGTLYQQGAAHMVSRDLATSLLVQDQKAFVAYLAQFEQKNRIVQIVGQGQSIVREVAPDAMAGLK